MDTVEDDAGGLRLKIGIISDIHSNLHALDAVLDSIRDEGIHTTYCLGDVVGYNAFPRECIERVRKETAGVLMGNHDHAVANKEYAGFNPLAVEGTLYSINELEAADLAYLRDLPHILNVELPETDLLLCHGSPDDPLNEYVFPRNADDTLRRLEERLDTERATILALGHTHVPMLVRALSRKTGAPILVANPGSVGQPRDGDSRASYAVVDTATLEISFRRLAYDSEAAARAVVDAGLPQLLAERLRLGR